MTTLISLVSDQTIPNTIFILQKKKGVNRFLFLTTEIMEARGKTNAIMDACNLKKNEVVKLIIDQDKPAEIKLRLNNWLLQQAAGQKYLVHLTGGNKTTVLVVQQLMRAYTNNYYYLPINKQTFTCMDGNFNTTFEPITIKLDLNTYLKACGLFYSEMEEFEFSEKQTVEIFERYKTSNFDPMQFPFGLANDFSRNSCTLDNIRGVWFEHYVYYLIKRALKLDESSISLSVYIFQTDIQLTNDQEIDVLFVYENKLYQVECKVSLGKTPRDKAINDLFKMGAIASRFGLSAISVFFTLSSLRMPNGDHSSNFESKIRLLGIDYVGDQYDLSSSNFNFSKFLATERYLS